MKLASVFTIAVFFVFNMLNAAASFDGSEAVESLKFQVHNADASEHVAGSFESGDYERAIVVPSKPKRPNHVAIATRNESVVKAGDPVLVRVVAAGKALDGSAGQLQLKLQRQQNPWPMLSERKQSLSDEAKSYELIYKADRDYGRGEMGFVIFLGQQAQTIRIRSVKIYSGQSAIQAMDPAAEETVLYDLDFEGAHELVAPREGSRASISGNVPSEFTEDSSWADVDVAYSFSTEGVYAGEKSFRVAVSNIKTGYAQLLLDHFPASSDQYLKLRFALKGSTPNPIRFAIRERNVPFAKSWQATYSPSPEWKIFEALIPPMRDDPNAQFIIEFRSPGVYELDDFSIVAVPREAIESASKVEGNLLLHSSFPFGFQRPWTGNNAWNNGLVHLTDENVAGPTGAPALKVLGQNEHEFMRLPFKGKPGNLHTVSFWAKSGQSGTSITARIGPPSEKLWKGDWGSSFVIGPEWRRVSHTVMLPFHSDGFYILEIYMHTEDTIWVDGLMVEAADQVNEFERVAPVELTLIPTHGAENAHNVFFKGEPISVNVGMLGERPEGSKLVIKTKPFGYEGEEQINELPIAGVGLKEMKVDVPFELLGLPEFGTAYFSVQVFDEDDVPLSKLVETSVHVIREPRGLGRFVHDSPFGIHVAHNEGMITTAKRLGFNWARCFRLSWNKIQPEEDGAFHWEKTDEFMGWYQKNHLDVFGVFGHTPLWANMTGGVKNKSAGFGNQVFAVPDEHLDDWAEYAAQVAQRYQVVRVFETWNEPFLEAFFLEDHKDGRPVQAKPERLFKMTQAIHDRFEADGIDAKLAWNIGAHYPPHDLFDRALGELGMFDLHDVITYHSYERSLGGYPEDAYGKVINVEREFMDDFGEAGMPLWNTEGGPGGGHQHNIYESIPMADMSGLQLHYSKYLMRAWNSMLANGVERFFLYFLNSGGFWRPNYDLMQPDGSLAPNMVSFSNLAWHIEGKEFQKIVPLRDSFYAYLYEGADGVSVALMPRETGELSLTKLPDNWRASDLFGNRISDTSSRSDFWIYAEGANTVDVSKWLQTHFCER